MVRAVYSLAIDIEDLTYIYIGSTKDIKTRYRSHLQKLKDNKHTNKTLQAIYNDGHKYLRLEILESPSDDHAMLYSESEYIEYFKRIDGFIVCNVISPPKVLITQQQANSIRVALKRGTPTKQIYKRYKLSKYQLFNVKHYKTHNQ